MDDNDDKVPVEDKFGIYEIDPKAPVNLDPNEVLLGEAEVPDLSEFPAGTGNGFILCVHGSSLHPPTHWSLPGSATPLAMEENFPVAPGSYRISFSVTGAHRAPRPVDVEVRPGLGAVVIVTYAPAKSAA